MALSELVAQVHAVLVQSYPELTLRIGERHIREKLPLPRVVWVPSKDQFLESRSGARHQPRAIKTRRAGMDAYVFAETLEAAELLQNDVIAATHAVAHGSYSLDEAEWFTPRWLERGHGCIVKLAFDVPILAASKQTKVIQTVSFGNSGAVAGDGALTTGET